MPANVPSLSDAYRAVKPIVEAASQTVSPGDAIRVAEYVVTYAWMADYLGREPTADEHAAALDVSRRTYFRRRSTFREAFPGADSPLAVPGAREIGRQRITAPIGALRLT